MRSGRLSRVPQEVSLTIELFSAVSSDLAANRSLVTLHVLRGTWMIISAKDPPGYYTEADIPTNTISKTSALE